MAKTSFSPMAPARRGPELLAAIGTQLDAVPSALPTATLATSAPTVSVETVPVTELERPEAPSRPAPFVLCLSPDVLRQIDAKAIEAGVTMTVVIARALMAAGFSVPDDDLKDRRKRRYRG
jgi:hypothetical protein